MKIFNVTVGGFTAGSPAPSIGQCRFAADGSIEQFDGYSWCDISSRDSPRLTNKDVLIAKLMAIIKLATKYETSKTVEKIISDEDFKLYSTKAEELILKLRKKENDEVGEILLNFFALPDDFLEELKK